MTQLSPTALEAAAKAVYESKLIVKPRAPWDDGISTVTKTFCKQAGEAAITAYLAQVGKEGWVMVPGEITEAMRWATWIDQSRHVGANDQEARVLAGRRMIDNPEQKAMDESAYRAMIANRPLAAAQNGGE
ncbi:MAG: hypothetical protein WBB98_04985 [Xanthobacteraceae bacterium]